MNEEHKLWLDASIREKKRKLNSMHKHKMQRFFHAGCGGRVFYHLDFSEPDEVLVISVCRRCHEEADSSVYTMMSTRSTLKEALEVD